MLFFLTTVYRFVQRTIAWCRQRVRKGDHSHMPDMMRTGPTNSTKMAFHRRWRCTVSTFRVVVAADQE